MRKTNLRKMAILPIALCSSAMFVSRCVDSTYEQIDGNKAKQVAAIIRDNGCLECHSANAPMPFYGKLPLHGPVVKADMVEGTRYVDFTALVEALENEAPVSEAD